MNIPMIKTLKEKSIAKRPNSKKALEQLHKIRELVAQKEHPFKHMTEEEIILSIKKERNERWEAKFAHRP